MNEDLSRVAGVASFVELRQITSCTISFHAALHSGRENLDSIAIHPAMMRPGWKPGFQEHTREIACIQSPPCVLLSECSYFSSLCHKYKCHMSRAHKGCDPYSQTNRLRKSLADLHLSAWLSKVSTRSHTRTERASDERINHRQHFTFSADGQDRRIPRRVSLVSPALHFHRVWRTKRRW